MNSFSNIILASQSPRRKDILKRHGIEPVLMPADIDETLPPGIGPRDAVMYLALKKALTCLDAVRAEGGASEGSLIIAADTVVYKDEILGKPKDRADAERILRKLSGTSHLVATGVALVPAGRMEKRVFCETTEVWIRSLTDDQLNAYLDTDEPYDKAGAYAIQGTFCRYVDHIDGDYENVIGLPYLRLREEMDALAEELESEK